MVINLHKHRTGLIVLVTLAAAVFVLGIFRGHQPQTPTPEQNPKLEQPPLQGEMMPWEEVNLVFPKYAEAEIIHVGSESHFRVQRRGGTYHADVQPLTAEDTAIMKKIYGNKWSWNRKPVILELPDGRQIAASMNGMPHGGGNIANNDFDGHFCIHFLGSKTHCSSKIDPGHQLMVWIAGGQLDQRLAALAPREVVSVFLAALDNHEPLAALKLVKKNQDWTALSKTFEDIDDLRIYGIEKIDENHFRADIGIISKGSKHEWKPDLHLTILNVEGHNKIDPDSLKAFLQRDIRDGSRLSHSSEI